MAKFLGDIESPIEVDRADEGLECIGQGRDPLPSPARFLSPAEDEVIAKLHFERHTTEVVALDERRAPVRQLPFGLFGKVI